MLTKELQKRLFNQEKMMLTRQSHIITSDNKFRNRILVNGKNCINFSSNDYLGLTKHPKITDIFSQAAKKYGLGSGASALVSGYSNEHYDTELRFSKWLNVDKAVLFSSGYLANLGIIGSLINRTHTVFSDKLCHASLLDGIQLSRAKHYRYRHCDTAHLHQLARHKAPDLIISESVFSMEGNVAPINDLVELSKSYQSGLVIDDAHGIGVLGNNGAGICEYYNINQNQFSCLVLPLGKAFNAMGAIVAGKEQVMNAIIQFSRTYRYTTALPPAICTGVRAALEVVQEEKWRRDKLKQNIRFFIACAVNYGLNGVSKDETPIKPILVYSNYKVMALQDFLLSKGLYVSAIRPPTIPNSMARLRVSLNCLHTQEEMVQLIESIAEGLQKCSSVE